MTPLGVLKDTPESYNPTKFEADRPNGLGVITNCNSLKDRVKQQTLTLLDLETGSFKRNSCDSLWDRVMVCRQLGLMDSCFSFFGFEITTSTLMAKNLFTIPGPPAKRDAS